MNRPDKIHATRTGGYADVELFFDGKTLTVLGKNINSYASSTPPARSTSWSMRCAIAVAHAGRRSPARRRLRHPDHAT